MTGMIEFANDLRIPYGIIDSPALWKLYEVETLVRLLHNDVIIMSKETFRGEFYGVSHCGGDRMLCAEGH